MAGAQAVFYVARGVAVLLAAMAVGLGAASDETERPSAAYPASSHTTARWGLAIIRVRRSTGPRSRDPASTDPDRPCKEKARGPGGGRA